LFDFIKQLAWNTGKKFQRDNCPQLAAAITYYTIFSLFPFLIFVAGIVGMFLSTGLQRDVVDQVLKNIPLSEGQGRNDVNDALDSISGANARALGIIGLAGLLWSSSSMFGSIRRALNIIYRDPDYNRPWFQQKVVDLALTVGLAVFFLSSVAATAALRIVEAHSEDAGLLGDLSHDARGVWLLASYAIPFAFSFLAFTFAYTLVPSRNRNLGNAWPGALVSAVLFELVKGVFALYVANFRNYDVVYGSLGAIITFMFWVYLSSQILLLGAEVATVYPQVRDRKVRQPRLSGLGVPFQVKLWRTVRSLFIRPPDKPVPPP
jgi:membrane protein